MAESAKPLVKRPLFVFGTLRRGRCNHRLLERRYLRMYRAKLPGYAKVAPLMIAPREGSHVAGEVYLIRPDLYRRVLLECDRLEGIPLGRTRGSEYTRVVETVETPLGEMECWVYVSSREL